MFKCFVVVFFYNFLHVAYVTAVPSSRR